MNNKKQSLAPAGRLASLDFLKGLTMVLLTLEATELFWHLEPALAGTAGASILNQFFHHPWNGLRLWDLIQPTFMFSAGVALAYSVKKQRKTLSWNQTFGKVLKRCGWLFFWGMLDYAVRKDGLSFELWDVLTQLSFTTLVAFLIMEWSFTAQVIISILCLVIPEILYRYTHIPNFNQPFTDQHNFGNYMDLVLMNKINGDGWVAINCISTSAHTIWGVLAGQLLMSEKAAYKKLQILLVGGLVLLSLGFALEWMHITPIIKRIATSSFVLASGGWVVLFLAFCYWWIDILNHRKYIFLFNLFALNLIFIYLFNEIVGHRWFVGYIFQITNGLFGIVHLPAIAVNILGSIVVFSLEVSLLYFLYKKKIFFRI